MDRAFDSDMAQTIGFAARRLGSAIVSIATMRMSEVARAAVVYTTSDACHMPARGIRGHASEGMRKGGRKANAEAWRASACIRAEELRLLTVKCSGPTVKRQHQRIWRPSGASRTSKEGTDAESYRGPLAVLVDAKFHSADEISIEGLLEEQWREGRHAMKNR